MYSEILFCLSWCLFLLLLFSSKQSCHSHVTSCMNKTLLLTLTDISSPFYIFEIFVWEVQSRSVVSSVFPQLFQLLFPSLWTIFVLIGCPKQTKGFNSTGYSAWAKKIDLIKEFLNWPLVLALHWVRKFCGALLNPKLIVHWKCSKVSLWNDELQILACYSCHKYNMRAVFYEKHKKGKKREKVFNHIIGVSF